MVEDKEEVYVLEDVIQRFSNLSPADVDIDYLVEVLSDENLSKNLQIQGMALNFCLNNDVSYYCLTMQGMSEGVYMNFDENSPIGMVKNSTSLQGKQMREKIDLMIREEGWGLTCVKMITELKMLLSNEIFKLRKKISRFEIYRNLFEMFDIPHLMGLVDIVQALAVPAKSKSPENVRKRVHDRIIELVNEQIKSGGPTLFFNIDILREGIDAHLVPRILEDRDTGIKKAKIRIHNNRIVDFSDLVSTWYGLQLLKTRKIWFVDDIDTLEPFKKSFQDLGYSVAIIDAATAPKRETIPIPQSFLGTVLDYLGEGISFEKGLGLMAEIRHPWTFQVMLKLYDPVYWIKTIFEKNWYHSIKELCPVFDIIIRLNDEDCKRLLSEMIEVMGWVIDFDANESSEVIVRKIINRMLEDYPRNDYDLLSEDGQNLTINVESIVLAITRYRPEALLEYIIDVWSVLVFSKNGYRYLPGLEKSIEFLVLKTQEKEWLLKELRNMFDYSWSIIRSSVPRIKSVVRRWSN